MSKRRGAFAKCVLMTIQALACLRLPDMITLVPVTNRNPRQKRLRRSLMTGGAAICFGRCRQNLSVMVRQLTGLYRIALRRNPANRNRNKQQ